VHFKVILRTRSGERYAVPAGQSVQIVIEDPTSKQVYQNNLPVSSLGTVSRRVESRRKRRVGLLLDFGEHRRPTALQHEAGGFHVEEYKKPEYEVKVTPSQARRAGRENRSRRTIEAKYYFGEPVAGAAGEMGCAHFAILVAVH